MSAADDRAAQLGLPINAIVATFDRDVTPAQIARAFGIVDEVPLITEIVTTELSKRGLSAEQIAERFARVWGLA